MADFRQVHCKTWRDDWFSELPTDAKLLWLYLITNQATSVSGIYQLPVKFIAFETGLEKDRILQILDTFKSDGKIDFDDSVIWVKKFRDYQATKSNKVEKRIMLDFNSLPDCRVKGIYAQKYGIDTVSIPYFQNAPDTDTDTETETETETEPIQRQPAKPDGLNDLQRSVLDTFGAKRFANKTQAALVAAWDRYPAENVKAACTWAATKGFGLGQAIASIDKALPKWGAPKSKNGSGKKKIETTSISDEELYRLKLESENQKNIPGTAAYRLAHRHDDDNAIGKRAE